MKLEKKIRLGKINFANCDFPYYGMEHGYINVHDIAIIEGHPVELAWKLACNELDISPISSNDFTKSVLVCAGCEMKLPELKPGEAALLIGDSALRAVGKYRIIADLGNEWKKLTGRKMVYAVWAVRKEYARDEPRNVRYTLDCLLKSKEYACMHVDEIAVALSKSKAISVDFMNEYLHTLNYDFDSENHGKL